MSGLILIPFSPPAGKTTGQTRRTGTLPDIPLYSARSDDYFNFAYSAFAATTLEHPRWSLSA
jgi:hypothetical protein